MAYKKLIKFSAKRRDSLDGHRVPSRWNPPVGPPEGTTFIHCSYSTSFGRLTVKPVAALTAREAEECRQLTLGQKGDMLSRFNHLLNYNREGVFNRQMIRQLAHSHVILAKDIRGKVLGWILAFESYDGLHVYTYVDPLNRRRGVGSALLEATAVHFREGLVHPWNSEALAFYSKFEFAIARCCQTV